jgi:hypothetical protein
MLFRARTNAKNKFETNWDVIETYLSRFKPNTLLEIEIKKLEKKNSDPMRAYYYSQVLPPLLEATGYERYEGEIVHHTLKGLFFENHKNEEWRTKKDERGLWRNVPHVFSKKSPIPISFKREFIAFVERIGAKYGAEYDK